MLLLLLSSFLFFSGERFHCLFDGLANYFGEGARVCDPERGDEGMKGEGGGVEGETTRDETQASEQTEAARWLVGCLVS